MARKCPETGDIVLYLTCLECETKTCKKKTRETQENLHIDVKNYSEPAPWIIRKRKY